MIFFWRFLVFHNDFSGYAGEQKQRLHLCHICKKTYGKTSHLRAHLRWFNVFKPNILFFKEDTLETNHLPVIMIIARNDLPEAMNYNGIEGVFHKSANYSTLKGFKDYYGVISTT